jgi:hypothetical protein
LLHSLLRKDRPVPGPPSFNLELTEERIKEFGIEDFFKAVTPSPPVELAETIANYEKNCASSVPWATATARDRH